jgi:hypothetical protein
MLLSQFDECIEKFFSRSIGLHGFSPTLGSDATEAGQTG